MWRQAASALLVLGWLPTVLAINPQIFDPEDNLRPDNASDLDYTRYDKIGSYYKGSLFFYFTPEHFPDTGGGDCEKWENNTMQMLLPALAGIQKRPKDDDLDNPFLLVLWAWEAGYTLGPANETANYSDYESFETRSQEDNELRWEFDMLPRNDSLFAFKGFMANSSNLAQEWNFNATNACDGNSPDDLLFSGRFAYPGDGRDYEWSNAITPATIEGSFDDANAIISIDALYEGRGTNTNVAGALNISFVGQIDERRSDRLLVKGEAPEWEPLVGFREEDRDDDSGAALMATGSTMAFCISIFLIEFLLF